jgi:hypothetical protein
MSARTELNSYLTQLERRLRLRAAVRGAAILTSASLAATVVLVLIANAFAFSSSSVTGTRFVLLLTLALAISFGLIFPLLDLTRRHAAGKAETAFPKFQQRLVTFAERGPENREPFIELLAADTLQIARESEPKRLVPDMKLLISLGVGIASLGVLVWMIVAGPGYLGYGASLLWAGPHVGSAPFYDIRVTPGDASVRRNADQLVTAQPVGMMADRVRLYARYHSASKWEQVAMQPQPGGSGFQFVFAGLPEGVEYYVQAGSVRSRHYNIRVVDLPAVKQIRVTYRFPSWTGMKDAIEEHAGDLHAVEGTQADLEILTDRPMRDGILVLDNGQRVELAGGQGNRYSGTIKMDKDGAYHVAAIDQGQPVRLSEDFFIEANKANPPEIQVLRPGPDYRASPIEEVTVAVKAEDQFGVNDLALHYSVNGGAEQTANLLKQKGQKAADGSIVLYFENLKMAPGDIVSFYASAKDAHSEAHTDMYFIQADPFEREFSQSQQSPGGGGGGGQADQNDISEREKEIIASTWKQQLDKSGSSQRDAENAKFLSEVQSKLRDQALALAGRLQMRELNEQNEEFSGFQKDMAAAADAMNPAAQKLSRQKWSEALPNEQKALQHLLQAEATFRQIQVAFGNAGSAGGGGAGRDLASLFDLELDTQKNQYETAQTASSGDQRAKEIDDALKKLDELARRQQELAQQRTDNGQSFEQRWQQEMLRRQEEQLQQEMQQLTQAQQGANSPNGPSAGGPQSSGQSSAPSSRGDSQGSSDQQRVQQALDQLRRADDDMRRAASQQSNADARSAAARLRQATNLLSGMQRQQASNQLDSIGQEADRIAAAQREQYDRLRRLLSQQDSSDQNSQSEQQMWNQAQSLAQDRQKLADDLSRLETQAREAARDLASTQHDAAAKLRNALGDLDGNDTQTRLQRSADWLRRRIDPNSQTTEPQLSADLQHFTDQIREAQKALGPDQSQDSQTALDRVARLRDQMEALTRDLGARGGQTGQRGTSAEPGQGDREAQMGPIGREAGPNGGPANGRLGGALDNGYRDDGYYTGGQRAGGGRAGWWIDTGNNSKLPQPTGPNYSTVPPDPERTFQQSMGNLNQLRQDVGSDPETARELQQLIQEMQGLDPKRFPGNPALLEQLHNQVLEDVNNLELQLRRKLDDSSGDIRSSDPMTVPSGYQDAVADYFRRLSKNQ